MMNCLNRLLASSLTLAAGSVLLTGCGRNEVRVYQVPKEKVPTFAASTNPADPSTPRVTWTTPSGWEQLPGNAMRVGSFVVKGTGDVKAEVSVVPFPGSAGTELGNVNRWRGQVGLESITADDMKPEEVDIGGEHGHLYDMLGAMDGKKTRILAVSALVKDTSWFFKMTGDDALVASQKKTFIQFLGSVRFAGPAPETSAASPAPTQPEPKTETPAPSPGTSAWQPPAGWKEIPASQMLLAKFSVPGGAEASISSFPGDVGGLLANVNRWRGQIGLGQVDAAALSKVTSPLEVGGGKATLVDMMGGDGKTRLVAAVVPRDGKTWFFKLLGDSAAVGHEKESFTKFVQTARF